MPIKKPSKSLDLTKAPEMGEKSLLYLVGFALIIAGLANTYFMLQMTQNIDSLGKAIINIQVKVPQENPSGGEQPTQPQADPMALLKPETKALIEKYSVSGTPTLVINCNKERVGTYAVAEEQGRLPEGSELQTLTNTLCDIAGGGSVFCADKKEVSANVTGITIDTTTDSPCGSAEKILIYSFHSPTCGYCDAQEPVLTAIEEKYKDAIQITRVCTPIHGASDVDLCKQQTDKYDMI